MLFFNTSFRVEWYTVKFICVRLTIGNFLAFMGRLFLASCQSQTFEVGNEVTVRRVKEKELESEEEEDSSTDMPYSENEQELPDSSRSAHKRR